MEDEDKRTVWVGNFSPEDTTEEILYELFMQAGPLHYVKIPKDKTSGRKKSFGFICYRHSVSVPYAIQLLDGIYVYGRCLKVQSRNHSQHELQDNGGIHSLDPDFGKPQNFSGPSHSSMQSHIQLPMQGPSLLGYPNQNIMTMAQQQMALLNAFQPIPLSANPLLNAPRERYSDRHGSLNYNRNNQYMRDNSSRNSPYQKDNGSRSSYHSNDNRKHNYNNDSSSSPYHHRDNKEYNPGMAGNTQRPQGRFDYNRLGATNRESHYRSHYSNDHDKRHNDRNDSHHYKHNRNRSSDRPYSNHHDSRKDRR